LKTANYIGRSAPWRWGGTVVFLEGKDIHTPLVHGRRGIFLPDEVCSVNTTILFYTADILQDTSQSKEITPKNYTQTAHFYSHILTF
jgi:hypothetical protein